MVAGTLAVLSCVSLAVLIQTDWFSGLEQALKMKRQGLVLGLLAETALFRVELPVGEVLRIQAGMLLMIPFLIRLWKQWRRVPMDLFPTVFLAGSILFLLRELYWLDPMFNWSGIRGWVIGATTGMALLSSRRLHVRLTVGAGGLWMAEWMALFLHRNEINPVVFGNPEALDAFWISLTAILIVHYALLQTGVWVRLFARRLDGGQ